MKIELWWIGKTNMDYLEKGIREYEKRLKHYSAFEIISIPDIKGAGKLDDVALKKKEAEIVLKKLSGDTFLVLLDEKGKQLRSLDFATYIQKKRNQSTRKLVFLIGGAFGFHQSLYARADEKLSLSNMTFSHQMVRLFFIEQLYRAFTILSNEKYHNE